MKLPKYVNSVRRFTSAPIAATTSAARKAAAANARRNRLRATAPRYAALRTSSCALGRIDTAEAIGVLFKKRPGHADPASFVPIDRSGRLLLTQRIDELDQLDSTVPVLGGRRVETFLLAVGQAVERRLLLGRRLREPVVVCPL